MVPRSFSPAQRSIAGRTRRSSPKAGARPQGFDQRAPFELGLAGHVPPCRRAGPCGWPNDAALGWFLPTS